MDDTGCIRADVVASMVWEPVDVRAGQTLWFHSRTPHRSGPNLSTMPRRAKGKTPPKPATDILANATNSAPTLGGADGGR